MYSVYYCFTLLLKLGQNLLMQNGHLYACLLVHLQSTLKRSSEMPFDVLLIHISPFILHLVKDR